MADHPVLMAAVRGLHLAAALSLLGTAGFLAWMLPAAGGIHPGVRRRVGRAGTVSGVLAIAAGAGWFVLQAAAIAGAETWQDLADVIPVVALHTRFGTVLLARLALLVTATVLVATGRTVAWYFGLLLTAAALVLQGLIGHAGATGGVTGDGLVLSESLHLLAAGLWLGALLPLFLCLLALPPARSAPVCERFSPVGLACVLVLAATGLAQGLELIGSLPALFGTRYGQIAVLKITLFLVALGLAAMNRLWLTDRLADGRPAARRHLLISVGIETLIGLAIVAAAAFMASSPPAAHTTPVWPFGWQFTLATVQEDPDFRREVLVSLGLIAAAAVLLLVALLARRFRLAALVVLVAAAFLRGPSLTLLTAEAYPTSFQVSPTDFAAASIVRGQALYGPNCAGCHGADGRGDGPAAGGLRIRPADLTMPHLWDHSDGELFWWLSHGMDDPEGGLAMPGFAASLSESDRWALIDYIRARNAALVLAAGDAARARVPVPAMAVSCVGIKADRMADLRGRFVLIVAGDAPVLPPGALVVTVSLGPAGAVCAAADASAPGAFAVLADVPSDRLAGSAFLVDPAGWLRAERGRGAWKAAAGLPKVIQDVRDNPLLPTGDAHEHHH
jgi:putative copper export protein/mono/diheme cytochrome c family protein